MVAIQGDDGGACEMNGAAIDINEGAPGDVEIVKTLAQAGELLVQKPTFKFFDHGEVPVRLLKVCLNVGGRTRGGGGGEKGLWRRSAIIATTRPREVLSLTCVCTRGYHHGPRA